MWQQNPFCQNCPLSKPDNKVMKGHYTDCGNANSTDSTTDKVMQPLTRIFTDLVAQLKLLTPSGHGSHGETPTYDRKGRNSQQQMGFHNGHGQHTNDGYHYREDPNQDCHIDHHHIAPFRHSGHRWSSRNGTCTKGTPGSKKLGAVVNVTQSAQSCPILRSSQRRR